MSYRSTLQADALKLVAKKLQSSLAVEGELPEDGLAAFGDEGDDLMIELARKIVSGEREEAETVEEVFSQARHAVTEAEELLVDADWRPADVNGNGHLDALGPTVELVQVNSHNGNGHRGDADEPQKSLFSWAEFLDTEPERPRSRRRKPQPASMSIFEWAFEQERERKSEAELVAAGTLGRNTRVGMPLGGIPTRPYPHMRPFSCFWEVEVDHDPFHRYD